MEKGDTGVIKYAIGIPTEEERKKLIEDGYTHMRNGHCEDEKHEPYEIWIK